VKKLLLIFVLQGYMMASVLLNLEIKGVNIPVIFQKDSRLPLRNIELIFKDSGYLASNEAGVASLSAKLLSEGTKKDGSIEFAKELEDRALSFHIDIGRETFVISLSGLSSEFDFGLQKIKELLQDPNYTKESFKKVQTQQLGKILQKQNSFDYIAANNLRAILFPNTPLANPELGTLESVKAITLEQLREFIDSHLHLNNLIVVVGGDFEKESLLNSLKSLLEILTIKDVPTIKKFEANSNPSKKIVYKDTDQAYIYFGAPFNMEVNSSKRAFAKVASFILGSSGFGSRLMEEIRVKRGLAYSAYSRLVINKTNSYLSGYLQTKLQSANEAQEVVKEVVKSFVKDGVTQKELNEAKDFFLGSEPLRGETLAQKLHRDFKEYYDGLGLGYHKKELKEIKDMKLEDLNSFIKSHPEIVNLSFSIVTKKDN